ncbi:MAG: 4-demethylwyosine synthase TYW1 [Candidatus Odinarchaeia archaeon]
MESAKSESGAIKPEIVKILKKQGYHLVGRHSAVKKCRWLHKSLVKNESCYKEKFYGIESHRCVQCTPSVIWCTNQCIYCWRILPSDIGVSWNQLEINRALLDEPELILQGIIREHRKILTGYKPSHHKAVSWKKWNEANNPRHFAISLSGEPTLYPFIGELINLIKKRGATAFLVTNGTLPEVLSKLPEPTQLYISLSAPDKETYRKVCRPMFPDAWERLNESLSLLPSFKCPTALRLTLVNNYNIKNAEKYAKLIEKANPTYVEVKAAMFVGGSQLRLKFENMPLHSKVKLFAKEIAEYTGYKVIDEVLNSRVVLLSRISKPIKFT